MKKHSHAIAIWYLFFALVILYTIPVKAQTNNTFPDKKQERTITISINNVDYDEPALLDFREVLKSNVKVKQVNNSYAGGAAKIWFMYSGKATDLWDELPQIAKQSFKVSAIDESQIKLDLKTLSKQTESSKTTATAAVKKEECFSCKYYKTCYFDTSRVFDGLVYRGFKANGMYYYCWNGQLLRKYTGTDKKMYSQIIFKSNEPAGTKWNDTVQNGDINRHVVLAKSIPLKVGNKMYNDVMIVYHNYKSIIRNDYYARDSGVIKSDTVDINFNPVNAATMKGVIDQGITGMWKNYNSTLDLNAYYKFNPDGTYEFYSGTVSAANQMPKGKCYWRVNNTTLELFSSSWNEVIKVNFQKNNDALSGKPALVIHFSDTDKRTFISEDKKELWK